VDGRDRVADSFLSGSRRDLAETGVLGVESLGHTGRIERRRNVMPYRAVIVLSLALSMAAEAAAAAAVHGRFGETRAFFRDWLAACRNDGSGTCSAVTYVRDPERPGEFAAQLRVARPRPGTDFEIVFTPSVRFTDLTRPMTLRVDDTPAIELAPGSGFGRAGGLNDYGIVDPAIVDALIPRMKYGARLRVDTVDEAGQLARFQFSLMGLTDALRFIDDQRARNAEATPASDPEALRHDDGGPETVACRGNEPFWTLTITGTEAEYARLTDVYPPEAHRLTGTMQVRAFFKPALFVWRGRGHLASGDIVAMITGERCLDTMSEGEGRSTFDYTVRMSMPNGDLLTGCCTADGETAPATAPSGPVDAPEAHLERKAPDDWSRQILELLPAIRACLAETPGPVARVIKAWPMNRGMVGARTRDDNGNHWNCVAPAEGGEVSIFAKVPEGSKIIPGETRIVFTPVPQAPPMDSCQEHERISDPKTGSLLGWLSYDVC
jgi:uncharacterized membrane protein